MRSWRHKCPFVPLVLRFRYTGSIVPTETKRNDEPLIPLTAHSDYETFVSGYTLRENPLNSKRNCGFTYDISLIFTMHHYRYPFTDSNFIHVCNRYIMLDRKLFLTGFMNYLIHGTHMLSSLIPLSVKHYLSHIIL